jgi:hypothetical protein
MHESPATLDPLAFNRGVVRPIECLRGGWQLIKDEYWLFLGITLVGVLIASVAPMGILMGPMFCGIYLCLLRRWNGQAVTFDRLFKGFDYFLPGFIVTLIMMVPMMVVMIGAYIVFFAAMFTLMGQQPRGGPPDPAFGMYMMALMAVFFVVIMLFSTQLQALLLFSLPLIVDREVSGLDAVRLSIRAVFANLGGVLGLVLLTMLLGFVGLFACYVGAIFVLPISFAANTIAYRQVFPSRLDMAETEPDPGLWGVEPPPPAGPRSEGITGQPPRPGTRDDEFTGEPPG